MIIDFELCPTRTFTSSHLVVDSFWRCISVEPMLLFFATLLTQSGWCLVCLSLGLGVFPVLRQKDLFDPPPPAQPSPACGLVANRWRPSKLLQGGAQKSGDLEVSRDKDLRGNSSVLLLLLGILDSRKPPSPTENKLLQTTAALNVVFLWTGPKRGEGPFATRESAGKAGHVFEQQAKRRNPETWSPNPRDKEGPLKNGWPRWSYLTFAFAF